jgi:pimeloyl-ACP methyl ester carboxylesterase
MKYNYFFLIFCIISINVYSQTYEIGHLSTSFIDASRSNRTIPVEIYYPANSAGDNVPVTTLNTLKFPVLVFGHGFVMTWDAYQNFWSAIVPNGYIMVFPKTEGSIAPSHLEFGKDLSFLINQMNSLGNLNSSIFYNRISTMNSVMGHSMGAGSSFLAVPLNTEIKTIVNFAAAETNPSAIAAASNITVPSLIFAGANDCVAPPNSNQLPMYNALLSSCKTYISITGGSHCQMANSNALCNFGEATCTPTATITRSVQHAKIMYYLLPWLDYQLKGNCNQGNLFDSQIVSDTSISFNKNCNQCNILEQENFSINKEVLIYPNPANDYLMVKGHQLLNYKLKVYDINSNLLFEANFIETTKIDISKWSAGIYLYEIITNQNSSKGKFIKK